MCQHKIYQIQSAVTLRPAYKSNKIFIDNIYKWLCIIPIDFLNVAAVFSNSIKKWNNDRMINILVFHQIFYFELKDIKKAPARTPEASEALLNRTFDFQ